MSAKIDVRETGDILFTRKSPFTHRERDTALTRAAAVAEQRAGKERRDPRESCDISCLVYSGQKR
jgi:hypothetical protein